MPLNRAEVAAAALELLDDDGLDGVTMRKLAQRLGVQGPTLYWHVRNKAALIVALADAILQRLDLPAPREPWREWLTDAATRLRRAMLDHRDGARVVAAAHLSTALAEFSEVAMKALVDAELPLREARLTVLAVQRFTVGFVLDEQSPPPGPDQLTGQDFADRHPTTVAAATDYFRDGRTTDDFFRDSIELILR